MTQDEFDLEQFAKMLDDALNSNSPAVKKALSNFLLIAALCNAQQSEDQVRSLGPFEKLIRDCEELDRRVRTLERERKNFSTGIYGPGSGAASGINPNYHLPQNKISDYDFSKMISSLKNITAADNFNPKNKSS